MTDAATPKLLDLFCGAGGAAMGYHRAGFDVTGIDIRPQPHYPFRFIQGDALHPPVRLEAFDVIHASPPCQAYTQSALSFRNAGKVYPDLVAATRALLESSGLVSICGCRVGLKLRRVRWFETSWRHFGLEPTCHHTGPVVSVVGHGTPTWVRQQLGFNPTIRDYREAMGIDWMNRNELSQAIPPAYTEYSGHQLMEARVKS